MKILHNRNLDELTTETDLLGLTNKSKTIQFFIENLVEENNVQMIALYGDWGSGKTSIMKDIERNLKKDSKLFHSVFFEVWKHEKDDNIALSLLSCLTNDLIQDKVVKETFDEAIDLFKSFGSGITLDFSIGDILGANKAGVKISPKEMMDSYKKLQKERYSKSYLAIQEKFKKQIGLIEHKILEKNNIDVKKGKIVVFLDDLDRCEPEVVLDLLAAIKLFYTYGKRLIFVCGVDKIAVQNAVRTRYSQIIKSDEYLEKIFDASFQVPTVQTYDKLLNFYFGDATVRGKSVVNELTTFFEAIKFNRPRHLKKILNKYAILVELNKQQDLPKELSSLIPNIIDEKNVNGVFFETVVTLYFIILHEFYPTIYDSVKNKDKKLNELSLTYHSNRPPSSEGKKLFSQSISHVDTSIFSYKFFELELVEINNELQKTKEPNRRFSNDDKNKLKNQFFILFLTAEKINSIDVEKPLQDIMFIKQFENNDNKITTDFCHYLNDKFNDFLDENWSKYNFQNYFRLIQDLL